uniref:Uncharacterized protein n=1 Tax=Marseillevirus LCMAC202 TaxID=2506606 RepID=A0A481YYU4_9VIRU|nr:MAG: hypothetical protein LCMAC202_00500 [Marseillevirus LCMAC202]
MTLPLEILSPKQYGEFDMSQLQLITNENAYDLVLIENASELLRQVMHDKPGNLEALLKIVVESAKSECIYLASETFPYYLNPKTISDFPGADVGGQASAAKYNNAVQTYKRNHLTAAIKKNKCIVGLFAADLLEAGGHYAAYIWNKSNKKLVIFDSMATITNTSAYYPFFQQLGKDLFGVPKELAVPCLKGLLSLQQTGGFAGNLPYITKLAMEQGIISPGVAMAIGNQSTESQNHFCYIWSIWFIHLLLTGQSLEEVTTIIRNNELDPLFVIKRYAWSMFKLAGLEKQLKHSDLYKTYFPRVWVNSNPIKNDFKPYILTMYSCKSGKECLKKSISPAVLKEVAQTPVPKKVSTTVERLLQAISI